jgi:hypothetical protein
VRLGARREGCHRLGSRVRGAGGRDDRAR